MEMAKCRAEHGTLTVFFYCSHANSEHQAIAIISSLIKQICDYMLMTSKPIPRQIHRRLVDLFGAKQAKPDLEDMVNLFIELFPYAPNTIYVLDGLDLVEPEQAKCLLRCIKSVFCSDRASYGSQILLVSREQMPGFIDISTFIPGIEAISTSSNVMHDIELYINEGIADKTMMRRLTDDAQLLNEMRLILLTESSSMYVYIFFRRCYCFPLTTFRFLWVFLQIEIIWDTCFTDKEIRSALRSLPKDLEETYQRCMRRIKLDDARTVKALIWVSHANRPLHIEELREAVAFGLHDTKWDGEQLPRIDFILGSCANLITMDLTDYSIHFAHSSMKQFLENFPGYLRGYSPHPTGENLHCGEFCVAYLSFSDFALQLDKPRDTIASVKFPGPFSLAQQALGLRFNKRLIGMVDNKPRVATLPLKTIRTSPKPDVIKYRFLNYAIENWALHTKEISVRSPCWDRFQRLATTFNETWNFHSWVPSGRSMLSHIHSIFGWAVKEQHEPLLKTILPYRRELQLVCNLPLSNDGLPALHVACKLGHKKILKYLLRICDINMTDGLGNTALHYATMKGHTPIVEHLVCIKTIKLDIRSWSGCTPLWLASSYGHVDILAILLDHKAEFDITNHLAQTPLLQAAKNGHLEVVKLLCLIGANIEHQDSNRKRPINLAFMERHYELVYFLVCQGAKVSAEICNGARLLLKASMRGDIEIVESLLATGYLADTEVTDDEKRTSLSWAAGNGHADVVEKLLLKRAIVESHDMHGLTPVLWASKNGHDSTLMPLLRLLVEEKYRTDMPEDPQMKGHMLRLSPDSDTGEWGYYVLNARFLIMSNKTYHGIVFMDSLKEEYPTMMSIKAPPELGNLASKPWSKPEFKKPLADDFRLFYFTFTCRRLDDTRNSEMLQYHFAVTTEQERIDWLRELMIFDQWRNSDDLRGKLLPNNPITM